MHCAFQYCLNSAGKLTSSTQEKEQEEASHVTQQSLLLSVVVTDVLDSLFTNFPLLKALGCFVISALTKGLVPESSCPGAGKPPFDFWNIFVPVRTCNFFSAL